MLTIKNIIAFLLVVIVFVSCSRDLLEPVPETSLSDASAFSTPDKFLAGVNNLYAQLLNESFYGGRFIVFQEQRGDEFSQNDGNNSTGANVWNQTITSSGNFVNAVWAAAYRTINSANILLANIESTTILPDSLKKVYSGEAKFVRGLCYLSLVQTYARPYLQDKNAAALPLRLAAETNGGANDLAFSTVEQIYTQIITDLDESEAELPVGHASTTLNSSRAHKSTAVALKTRAYLVMGNYAKVVEEAQKLVPQAAPFTYTAGNVTHYLEPAITDVFSSSYTGPESILTLPLVNPIEAPGRQSALAYNYLYPILYLNASGIIADPLFSSAGDVRRTELVVTNAAGQLLLKKFIKNAVPYADYIPVIRYAEVILNYAEAAAHMNDAATAENLLYAIRHRSDPGFAYPAGNLADQSAIISTILTERRIELLGEGFRTMDMQRTLQTLPAKTGNAGTAPAVEPLAPNYVWDIPSDEISYNKLAPR